LELSAAAYHRLKADRKFNKICWIHYMRMYKKQKKIRANDDKGREQAEKARPIILNEKQDPFSLSA